MKRDIRIDFLRFIGILFVVLAHVSPPKMILIPRMFDVPLLTFAMGMSMFLSSSKKENYLSYVFKRFKRLLVPAFVFLLLFFVLFNFINVITNNPFNFTLGIYLGSFSTFSGIGFVWIIRVFFIMSLLMPVFIAFERILKNKIWLQIIFITILLVLHEVMCNLIIQRNGMIYTLISDVVVMSVGYAIVTQTGMLAYENTKKENIILTIYFFIIGSILLYIYPISELGSYKYPPFPVYLVYGIIISMILWYIVSIKGLETKIRELFFIKWFSENSMQIYYWHIIPVFYLDNYITDSIPSKNWLLSYLIVLSFAILGTMLQNKIRKQIKKYQIKTTRI